MQSSAVRRFSNKQQGAPVREHWPDLDLKSIRKKNLATIYKIYDSCANRHQGTPSPFGGDVPKELFPLLRPLSCTRHWNCIEEQCKFTRPAQQEGTTMGGESHKNHGFSCGTSHSSPWTPHPTLWTPFPPPSHSPPPHPHLVFGRSFSPPLALVMRSNVFGVGFVFTPDFGARWRRVNDYYKCPIKSHFNLLFKVIFLPYGQCLFDYTLHWVCWSSGVDYIDK